MWKRLMILTVCCAVLFSLTYMRVIYIMNSENIISAGAKQGSYTVAAGKSFGNIYDRNFKRLNNNTYRYVAVINPTSDAVRMIVPYLKDKDAFYSKLSYGKPFSCDVTISDIPCDDIYIFKVPVRTSSEQTAVHLVGYYNSDGAASGIERSFKDKLMSFSAENSVKFEIDGMGKVLGGAECQISYAPVVSGGVVTTIDSDIQRTCENALKNVEKGAVIVLEPKTGQILACASAPAYNIDNIEDSLKDERSPFLNRAFCPYSVGSAFKLVTAATALEEGISFETAYECKGSISIGGQIFRCHKLDGHGIIDMKTAMAESCNTYFIQLGQNISSENFVNKALALGFGKSTVLADGIVSSAGNVQSGEELSNSAEKANLSFGQGKLTATPLQVALMTAAVVNEGKVPEARLILGTTDDGSEITPYTKEKPYLNAIDRDVANTLKDYLIYAIKGEAESLCNPYNTTAGGKTSTAQTGRYDDNGKEFVNAWFTGFFPAENPKYVVTVLVEDGKSGNSSAGPIFTEIAENVTRINEKK